TPAVASGALSARKTATGTSATSGRKRAGWQALMRILPWEAPINMERRPTGALLDLQGNVELIRLLQAGGHILEIDAELGRGPRIDGPEGRAAGPGTDELQVLVDEGHGDPGLDLLGGTIVDFDRGLVAGLHVHECGGPFEADGLRTHVAGRQVERQPFVPFEAIARRAGLGRGDRHGRNQSGQNDGQPENPARPR